MKRTLATISLLLGLSLLSYAQRPLTEVKVNNVELDHSGDYMTVDMDLNLSELKVNSNRAVLLTPQLVQGRDTMSLPSIGIYGRNRYFYYLRNKKSMLSDENETTFKAVEKPDSMPYRNVVSFQDWMKGSQLIMHRWDYGCCHNVVDEQIGLLGIHTDIFFPELVYIRPKGDSTKEFSLDGSAFIDFPVDQTIIYPEYRRNVEELGTIQATIDSVNSDKDITITSVWLKGFASPESPYSHNTDLAIGRTAALKAHIQQLYNFKEGIITTDYEPENWEGLRKYVEKSNITHKDEILALIDSDMEPDPKEATIKKRYPQEYKFLLQNCYPALRRTDYIIKYIVRVYTSIEEIKRVMATAPQKLSLNEFFLLSEQYDPETWEFAEVFETAVRMYPDNEVANLNAANAAVRRNDMASAEKYLKKAGTSPEATYARAAYAFRMEDYDTALTLFKEAEAAGVEKATEVLQDFDKKKRKKRNTETPKTESLNPQR